jgi:serine-type D-Ala-D-Ala carboxypeptidase (penicillin-binding protein 5/6)
VKKKILMIILGIVLIFAIFFRIYSERNLQSNIVSPIPDFLLLSQNKQVSSINVWLPILTNLFFGKSDAPKISAKSALIFDTTLNKVLFEKNTKLRLPMASLTKIMTAIIASENKKTDGLYLVTKDDLVGENAMGLTAGETLSLNELLYGLVLNSGNDAAETLASNFKGGREAFILAMNEKAVSLGLSNTHFTNPSGLEGDGNQYTTVYDLLVITNYAVSNLPEFTKVVATFSMELPYSTNHKYFYLENETNLLTSYPGVKGVKDGYTPEAGLCLVTYLDYQNHKIIGIILGSDDRRGEMIELLDYSLQSIGIKPPKHG